MLFYLFVLLLLPLTEAVPSEVTGVNAAVVSGQAAIRVNWNKPSSVELIIRYEVEYGERGVRWIDVVPVQGADSLTTTITNLIRGTTYTVRVRAVSAAGAGRYTEPQRRPYLILPSLLPQVTGVMPSVVSGQSTIRVNWAKPTVDGTFIRYDVQYKVSSEVWTVSATGTVTVEDQNVVTVDLTNLQRGTTYDVRVRAVSNGDNGPFSAEATFTVPRLPPQVTGVSLSVVSGQAAIRVTWTKPSVEGTFMEYIVQVRIGSQSWNTETVEDQNVVTVVLTSLQRSTTYRVRVRAVSNAGTGPYSAEATFTLPGLPSQVTGVSLSRISGQRTITMNWNKPSSERTIIEYEVQYALFSSSSYVSVPAVQGANSLTTTIPGLTRLNEC